LDNQFLWGERQTYLWTNFDQFNKKLFYAWKQKINLLRRSMFPSGWVLGLPCDWSASISRRGSRFFLYFPVVSLTASNLAFVSRSLICLFCGSSCRSRIINLFTAKIGSRQLAVESLIDWFIYNLQKSWGKVFYIWRLDIFVFVLGLLSPFHLPVLSLPMWLC